MIISLKWLSTYGSKHLMKNWELTTLRMISNVISWVCWLLYEWKSTPLTIFVAGSFWKGPTAEKDVELVFYSFRWRFLPLCSYSSWLHTPLKNMWSWSHHRTGSFKFMDWKPTRWLIWYFTWSRSRVISVIFRSNAKFLLLSLWLGL